MFKCIISLKILSCYFPKISRKISICPLNQFTDSTFVYLIALRRIANVNLHAVYIYLTYSTIILFNYILISMNLVN